MSRTTTTRRRSTAGMFDDLIVRDFPTALVVDNFAGGGGASYGIGRAMGRPVDVAINHDRGAIDMHAANHPRTLHLVEDVWLADPVKITQGRPVQLAWFSPDCKHFSRAKGGKPVEKRIRGLAWVAVRWAKRVRPEVIILENVREFEDWGPLTADHRPCPDRKGVTFRRFVGTLRNMGYAIEWRTLNAADYGAPTHRRRLFLIARCDGRPIVWPAPTHGPGRQAYRTAAECIDWSIPCPSIFDRKRPLAEKTLRRIAMGLKRYVLENPHPFVVKINHGGDHFRGQRIDRPLSTVTHHHGHALVTPTLVSGYGEAPGQEPRAASVEVPLGAVVGTPKHALVTAFLSQFFGGMVGKPLTDPVPATTSKGPHEGLVSATLVGTGGPEYSAKPRPVDAPKGAVMPSDRSALAAAFLTRLCQNGSNGSNTQPADRPLTTIVSKAEHCVAAAYLARFNHGDKQWNGVDEPLGTVTSQGNKFGLVRAFLMKYYGSGGQWQPCDVPLHTATDRARFGLVTVEGVEYAIADIGLRMLTPRELARAQGFPDDYVLTGSNANQVARIGNSVPPVLAEVLVRANVVGAIEGRATA